jgi:hypothetical protein
VAPGSQLQRRTEEAACTESLFSRPRPYPAACARTLLLAAASTPCSLRTDLCGGSGPSIGPWHGGWASSKDAGGVIRLAALPHSTHQRAGLLVGARLEQQVRRLPPPRERGLVQRCPPVLRWIKLVI